jgi:hydroxypyruvate reductase
VTPTEQLRTIYIRALDACAPERLVRNVLTPDMPRNIVAIGKCAGALRDGLDDVDDAFLAVPDGYRLPAKRAIVAIGGHPQMTHASFAAGRQLLEFVDAHDEILFLISGGGSACVEQALGPWFEERDLIDTNAKLIASGLPIADINCVRKHLSAIKGGRLAARVKRSVTLIYSDTATDALADVASGPTLADSTTKDDAIAILESLGGCDRIVAQLRNDDCPKTVKRIDESRAALIADNATLVAAAAIIAASLGFAPVVVEQQIESDVSDAANALLQMSEGLRSGEILIAGGEPTVVQRGNGRGGRCMELAVRMAMTSGQARLDALLGTSDAVDGNSGVAAIAFSLPAKLDHAVAARELARSNGLAVAEVIGETIIIPPAGNNLRDLYLLARS